MRIILITQGVSPIVPAFIDSSNNMVGVVEGAQRSAPQRRPWRPGRLALWCLVRRIPYLWLHRGNQDELLMWTDRLSPELDVIYSLSQLLSQAVIDRFPHGLINLHPSALPEYRGPNPYFWAAYDQATHHGATVHYIDSGEDTGDILGQTVFEIEPYLRFADWQARTLSEGVRLLLSVTEAINDRSVVPSPQPAESPTRRARRIEPEAVMSTIDWQAWPLERVHRFVCQAGPWVRLPDQRGREWSLDLFTVAGKKEASGEKIATAHLEGARFALPCATRPAI